MEFDRYWKLRYDIVVSLSEFMADFESVKVSMRHPKMYWDLFCISVEKDIDFWVFS